MLEQLLGSAKSNVLQDLTSKLGLENSQAQGFLQQALALIERAFKNGKFDPSALLGGNLSSILGKLDLGSLSGLVGGDAGKAKTGMESVLDGLLNGIKNDPQQATALLTQLTGGNNSGLLGQVSGLAGKLFGKQ